MVAWLKNFRLNEVRNVFFLLISTEVMNTTSPNTEKSRPSYVDKNITKQILQREVTYHAELKNYNAHPTPLCFVDEISSNRALVAGLTLSQTLQSHRGCVNSVTWSEKGMFQFLN
jgi:hypothetical protein